MFFDSITGRYFLIFAAVYAAVKIYPRIKSFISIWQMRFKPDEFVLINDGESVPLARPVAVVLDLWESELQQLGFAQEFSFDCIGESMTRRCGLYAIPDLASTVAVASAPMDPPMRPYDIVFETRFTSQDGEPFSVETIGANPDLITPSLKPHVENCGNAPTSKVWERHLERVGEYEAQGFEQIPCDRSPSSLEKTRTDVLKEYENHVAAGRMRRSDDGRFQLSAKAALKVMNRAMSYFGAQRKTPLETENESAEVEAARCSLTRDIQDRHKPAGYLFLFLISFIGFFAAFGMWLGFDAALYLSIVIFVHELGHWMGMRLCGYRNARIFFVPLLGGVAVGKKNNPTPKQELIVLLPGPVPGLFIGAAIVILYKNGAGIPRWMLDFAVFSCIINYLNLLPVTPLDGGRIVNALYLRRTPQLRFFFSLLSVAALGLGAYFLESPLLAILTFFGLLRLRFELSNGKIEKAVVEKIEAGQADRDDATLLVVEEFRECQGISGELPIPARIGMVNLMVDTVSQQKASPSVVLVGSAVYVFCLAAPWVAYWLLIP